MMGSQALTFCFLHLSPQVLMMAPRGMLLGLLVTSWVTVCLSCKNSVSVFLSIGDWSGRRPGRAFLSPRALWDRLDLEFSFYGNVVSFFLFLVPLVSV